MPFEGLTFEVGSVVTTQHDPDEFLLVQPDALGNKPRVGGYQLHHPYGFASRALDADVAADGQVIQGKACVLLEGTQGNDTHAWLAQDPRITPLLPKLKLGESLQYGPTGQFVRCHEDGAISLFTTDDATTNGRSVFLRVAPDGFVFEAPWGRLRFGPDGFHVLHRSGARIDLGAIGGLPPPMDALGSYAKIAAAIVQVEAAVAAEGTVAGIPEPPAKSTSLLAVLDLMQVAMAAMVPALTPGAAATAAATAVTASATLLTLSHATIPSTSKQIT